MFLLMCLYVCVCACVGVYMYVCVLKVNFFSYIQMAWRALPSLEQSKGSLVVVSSVLGTFVSIFAFTSSYDT